MGFIPISYIVVLCVVTFGLYATEVPPEWEGAKFYALYILGSLVVLACLAALPALAYRIGSRLKLDELPTKLVVLALRTFWVLLLVMALPILTGHRRLLFDHAWIWEGLTAFAILLLTVAYFFAGLAADKAK